MHRKVNHPVVILTCALIWRGVREQGFRLWLFPCLVGGLLLGSMVLVATDSRVLTGFSYQILELTIEGHFGQQPDSNITMALVLGLTQGPYLVALIGALMASSFACAAFGSEASRGGLELMMSAPFRARDIFLALIAYVSILSAGVWSILIWILLFLMTIAIAILQPGVMPGVLYILAAGLMPLPVVLWASLIAVSIVSYFPRFADIRAGTTGNFVQLVSILPSLFIFLIVNLLADIAPVYLITCALGIGIAGSVSTAYFLIRGYKTSLFLQNIS